MSNFHESYWTFISFHFTLAFHLLFMYMKSLYKLNLMQTPKWDASSLTHIYKTIRLIACGDESYLLDRASGRQEGSVYCTDVPSGVNRKWRKWLNWQCWGDRIGHTALIQARFWPSAPARCFKEPPPLSVCRDRKQLSASLHQKKTKQFYTSKPKRPRAEQVSRTRSLYSCYTSSRNEVNCLFYI